MVPSSMANGEEARGVGTCARMIQKGSWDKVGLRFVPNRAALRAVGRTKVGPIQSLVSSLHQMYLQVSTAQMSEHVGAMCMQIYVPLKEPGVEVRMGGT